MNRLPRNAMDLQELSNIIQNAGGKSNALEYAHAIHKKIVAIEQTGAFNGLMKQLRAARQPGDLRGRLLEVNFAYQAIAQGRTLKYGVRQGMSGDIHFGLALGAYEVFIEMKLLGQAAATKQSMVEQESRTGFSSISLNDVSEIGRLQRDIVQKATTRKFNPAPQSGWINFVAVDVAELQIGMIDLADCLLATGGNWLVRKHCSEYCTRDEVVGVFERPNTASLTPDQQHWVATILNVPHGQPHPRDYIHGAIFLFREPRETAALSYDLTAIIAWNPLVIAPAVAQVLEPALQDILPLHRDNK